MAHHTCADLSTPGTEWSFCPSLGAAMAFCIFFALTFIAHVAQGIYYRKWYTWVIAMSALWQTIAYMFRIISIKIPTSLGDYAAWFVLILVSPLWTNAFVYMVVGRMVWNFTQRVKVFGISAWRFGMIFVILDIMAFFVQVTGAALASTAKDNTPNSTVLNELHIYMAGVGLQQLFILIFFVYALGLQRTIKSEKLLSPETKARALTLLYTLYACLTFITIRIIFRLVEYSSGLHSSIPNHEAFQYCLDSLPMLLALVLLNIVHPGRIMKGKDTELPSRKERKEGKISSYQLGSHGADDAISELDGDGK